MAKSKSAGGTRRTTKEVEELVRKASAAIDGGMSVQDACAKLGLAGSVFRRVASKLGITSSAGGRVQGSMRADQIPPRPKRGKGGSRTPKPVDENDVQSLAHRVSQLDRKLAGVDEMQKERRRLAAKLLRLLQGDTPQE